MYIDGDALPNILKPILLRTIERLQLQTFVISNKRISIGESKYVTYIIVDAGADEADNKIIEMIEQDDLVITADIPLADRVVTNKANAIDHRGELFDADNIKHYLAMRNLMEEIRSSGEITKGASAFTQKDAQKFANQLNKFFQDKINHHLKINL